MNRNSAVTSRSVRFDEVSAKVMTEDKVKWESSLSYTKDVEEDYAMEISKRILELSRERRRSQRSMLLAVAINQERLVKKRNGHTFLPSAIQMGKSMPLCF
jgi:hypothetical protein